MKIVKPEVWQEIVNLISNPDIIKRREISRKKSIFNNSSSSSSSSSESKSDDKISVNMIKIHRSMTK